MQRYNRIKNEKSLVEVQKGIIAIKLQHSKAYVAADHNYCLPPAKDLQRRVSVVSATHETCAVFEEWVIEMPRQGRRGNGIGKDLQPKILRQSNIEFQWVRLV